MKRGFILILIIIAISGILLAGCGMIPDSPEEAVMGKQAEVEEDTPPGPSAEELADQLIAQAQAEAASVPEPEINITENITEEIEPNITGTLDLQTDLDLCPHLVKEFECDRYDLRWCDTERIMGQEGFFPGYLVCRDSDPAKREKTDSRFCLVLDCSHFAVDNIVTQYGEYVALAEYKVGKRKDGNKVINTFTLRSCGEEKRGFSTEEECRFFGTRAGLP